ncbi:MAG TPA: GNAT family N-acetyltransferase [Ramlibacter sp.]|uniref:GNAT family N-acetyltransferase n=1 Tax=Ramlibacter sp. TaxID=1917967 RepID=UPI002C682163|nr:GNAT family N-acetyltransferase [Ramlibacter sp.]HVZ45371.1 GNAT family N-acetyltransferase [Ramlibacter sp.]
MKSFSGLRLLAPRIELRPLVAGDEPALFSIFSDREVMRYWSTVPWQSMDFAERFVRTDIDAMARGEHLRLGIVRREDDALLGMCTLFDFVEACRRCQVGYGLARSAWGKGYVHEALVQLLDYGFAELSLNRVEADIDPRNGRSARSLQRLGFRKEGHLRERWIVDGEVSDSELYGLLLSDWNGRSAS